jgi:hypothetical protein
MVAASLKNEHSPGRNYNNKAIGGSGYEVPYGPKHGARWRDIPARALSLQAYVAANIDTLLQEK